jgi:hypothetical protein
LSEDVFEVVKGLDLFLQILRLGPKRTDLCLGFQAVLDVPQDQRVKGPMFHLETGQGGLCGSFRSVQPPRGQSAGNPQVLLALGSVRECRDERSETPHAFRGKPAVEGLPHDPILVAPEDPQGGWICPRHTEVLIELDDGVEGAVDESPQLFFARADLALGAEAPEFGCGPGGEHPEKRHGPWVLGHRSSVEDREVAQDGIVCVQERDAHVAHGVQALQLRVVRKEGHDVVGIVDQAPTLDDDLTRRSVDGHFPAFQPRPAQTECQGAERPGLGNILGHPGAMGPQNLGEVLDQRGEEAFPGLSGRAFHEGPEGCRLVHERTVDSIAVHRGIVLPLPHRGAGASRSARVGRNATPKARGLGNDSRQEPRD